MIDRVRSDSYFTPIVNELESLMDPASFVGRCPEQVDGFLKEWVQPALEPYKESISRAIAAELNV